MKFDVSVVEGFKKKEKIGLLSSLSPFSMVLAK
jgi:hypothetical protein